jgi:phage tail P2-like protein
MTDAAEPQPVSLLPANASLLETGLDLAFAKLLERIEPPFPELMDPQATPAEFLPYLAADRGVSEWLSTAPESQKRATVASAWAVKRQAGTRRALRLAVESMGLLVEVVPWYRSTPADAPYSLRIVARALGAFDEADHTRLLGRLEAAKSERDLLMLNIVSEVHGRIYYGAAVSTGSETTVYPYKEPDSEVHGRLYYGLGLVEISTTTVYPQ